MSVTAAKLSRTGAKGKVLDSVIREQLRIIDDKLMRADRKWGRNVISVDLPSHLQFPGLDKLDSQRIVYCAIIRSLTKRGFGVRLLLETNRTSVFISWNADMNTADLAVMNKIIRSARITREELPAFLGTDAKKQIDESRDKTQNDKAQSDRTQNDRTQDGKPQQ